ncbi:MAG: copper chaperone PCu(A)C [Gammaproteobacteria bacterium]|nr:copper chaperone PCu(A)C [Gammaproteobacteria bacterium]
MKKLILVMLMAVISTACTRPAVSVNNAWIRLPPPNMGMTAGYVQIHNQTHETITIVGASSDAFADVSLHESRVVDGMSEMVRLRSVAVAPGDKLLLAPGGLHLMLSQPLREFERGDSLNITLQLANNENLSFAAIVGDQAR